MTEENIQEITLDIKAVSLDKGVVLTSNGMIEKWLHIVAPADIKYAKRGKALIRINEEGDIVYCRMLEVKPNTADSYKKDWAPKNGFSPKPNYSQKGFNSTSQYNPIKSKEDDFHYLNKIKTFNQYTLTEFECLYNLLSQNSWIIATQSFDSPMIKTDDEGKELLDKEGKIQRLFDFIVYMKVKPESKEEDLPVDY